jgi:1-pyrroline-5-carboxylate dehydrogenase
MRSPTPFVNEPFTDFSVPAHAAAFRQALARVEGQLGATWPCVIGGERVMTSATIASTNPAQPDQVIGRAADAGVAEADRAIAAATAAFPAWSATTFEHRAAFLFEMAARVRRDKHTWSAWMVKEVGKSWAEADGDTAEAIDFLEYYAREALRYGEGLPVIDTSDRNTCFYIPLGAGAVIAPWNFPFAILCGTVVSAVVAGNTVVMKPAEESSTVAFRLMELFEAVGLPPGVVNLLTGNGEVCGARIVQHPDTRFISFTGSKAVGLWIAEQATKRGPGQRWIKRVVAEMGGKDAMVIDAVKNVEEAAAATVAAAFGFQGQKCSACSRAIVVDEVHDAFVGHLVAHTRKLKLGDPSDPTATFGPVVSQEAYDKTLRYIAIGAEEGTVVLGGKAVDRPGWFIEPTIVTDIAPDARLAREEVFGPVLAVIRARDWHHALEIANDTEYGLTGGFFTDDEARVQEGIRTFHVGNLYVNRKCTGALVGAQPFGGYGMSGTCSKAGGPDYLGNFLQIKSVARKR